MSEVVVVSHAFDALLSQLPNPVLQLMEHAPSAQLAVPFVELQALPHALSGDGHAAMQPPDTQ